MTLRQASALARLPAAAACGIVQMGGMDGARLEGVMTSLNSVLQRAAADHGERPAVRMTSGKILRREVQPPEELR